MTTTGSLADRIRQAGASAEIERQYGRVVVVAGHGGREYVIYAIVEGFAILLAVDRKREGATPEAKIQNLINAMLIAPISELKAVRR